mmetsp:Transcript_21598/g.32146  ORF Transcript_21598/g.32146 Transcript_21598/m.32146 type:complete len:260 (-) Transcript_21598:233-1012(-)|eukprot:CAMPEP_0167749820 /NCGR_PEP_ID=MMETSP0110_2-20121227/5631_1 /TAXON_ID=629695 /ORGANISM="Gymnochlora sp., Strain CCMP2014" /LENGTH=259 /DNA_ID=CAMNT_0007635039 /DNA_START=98 /DNA_END=877 /DNA_ORIENTATION=+
MATLFTPQRPRIDNSLRILFIHGVQAGPNQYKAQVVAKAGFEVFAPDMGTKTWCYISIAILILISMALGMVAIQLREYMKDRPTNDSVMAFLAFMLSVIIIGWTFYKVNAMAWGWKFAQCQEKMQNSIESYQPHAIVASSFGAAVAVELMRNGHWCGATVLLSPAVDMVHRLVRNPGPLPLIPVGATVSVVHGRRDWIAPFTDARRLFRESEGEVQFIDAGSDGHFLHSWNDPRNMRNLIVSTVRYASTVSSSSWTTGC